MNNSQTLHLKREVLARLIQAYSSNDFENKVNQIPFDMRPKNKEVPYRCCIHKERAILRERVIANLGIAIENSDESKPLSEYAKESLCRKELDKNILTVIDTACIGCTPNKITVTDLCQGCVARPCIGSCNFGAITIKNGKSVIDKAKCKSCTKCIQACPYNAIAKVRVPCEDACPVGAIKKNEVGYAQIDFDKCIFCGACISSCPFGAVAEKSQIVDILQAINSDKRVVAMIAPAIAGQFPFAIEKIAQGLKEVGFCSVYEVAQGADITAKNEAVDFEERMAQGDDFMTTSCCAAYNELVDKHISQMKPYVSHTKTPLFYTAEIVKKENSDCVAVFVGPCSAKRIEGIRNENIDYVMSFEEMGSLFVALGVELSRCEDYVFKNTSSKQGRNFPLSGGVAMSVVGASDNPKSIDYTLVDGLNKQSVRELKKYAQSGTCSLGNLIEIMACPGGCVGGSAVLNDKKMAKRKVNEYADAGEDIKS